MSVVVKRLDGLRCHLLGINRGRRLCIREGPSCPQKKRHTHPAQFLADVHCGQTAGWIKMPLGTNVNLDTVDVVLDGVADPPKRGTSPSFRPLSIVAKRLYVVEYHVVHHHHHENL